jgi:hypothetical protein
VPAGALPVANRPAGTESALAATIVELIRAAQSPVILVGQGGRSSVTALPTRSAT